MIQGWPTEANECVPFEANVSLFLGTGVVLQWPVLALENLLLFMFKENVSLFLGPGVVLQWPVLALESLLLFMFKENVSLFLGTGEGLHWSSAGLRDPVSDHAKRECLSRNGRSAPWHV
jgi:hypothetical protein